MSEIHNRHGNGFLFQPLEERTLFAGFTVIAHDVEPFGARPAWLDSMSDAIVAKAGDDTAVYTLHIAPTDDPEFYDLTLEWLEGTAVVDGDNAEVILLVDWADASDPNDTDTTVTDIGFFIGDYLFEIDAELGLDMPLAELPIHLIGHGRGAGVVSELAWYLGDSGIWVDHLTLLDAPAADLYPDDQPVAVYDNVLFADAYYQTVADQKGVSVDGAVNHNLGDEVTTHAGVHAWYLDTIMNGGSGIGYDFSRLVGGERDPIGIGANFTPDGFGAREAVDRTLTQYPNVGMVTIDDADGSILQGHPLSFEYLFQDNDSDGDVEYYLDEDTNPYNANAWFLSAGLCDSAGGEINTFGATVSTADVPSGTYHLFVFVTDADGQTRYAYADTPVTLVTAPPTIGSLSRSSSRVLDGTDLTLTAKTVSPDTISVSFFHDSDGNETYDAEIDELLSIDDDGSDGWSFAGAIDGLPLGTNRFFAVATDTDEAESAAVTTTVIRAVPDDLEDNEKRDVARDLGLQTTITAYSGLNLLDDSTDWYRFRITSGADRRHVVKINFKETRGDLTLAIYNADGKLVQSGTQLFNKEVVPLDTLPHGTYYARVTGAAHPNYKLTIDAPEPKLIVLPSAVVKETLDVAETVESFTWELFNSKRRIRHQLMV